MVAYLKDWRLNWRISLGISIAAGAIAAALVAMAPAARLESLIVAIGLPALFSAAAPPLGATARATLALIAGGGAAIGVWLAMTLFRRLTDAAASDERDLPVLRRADAHPDAPARRPIRASEDFGRPLPMSAPAPARRGIDPLEGRAVPADLDTPLAAIDPKAIPESPREPVRPVAALVRPQFIDPGERFETFDLTPVRRAPPRPESATVGTVKPILVAPPASSIGSLIERLEQGAARRDTRPRGTIEETLGMLRSLATQ